MAASDGPGHRVAPPYGDDFIVISTRTPQVVVATLSGLLPSAVRTMPVRCSVAVLHVRGSGGNVGPGTVLGCADLAMHTAKRDGGSGRL